MIKTVPPCDASQLVPHRSPMRMVDRLLWVSDDGAGAEFAITPECPFLNEENAILPMGLIEAAAQACAAWQGFVAVSKQLPVRQGYLVGVDRFYCRRTAYAGERLFSTLRLATDLDSFMVVDARVENNAGEQLASLRLKVFAAKDN